MHIAGIVFIVLGCIAGFYAAYCWWEASRVPIDHGWTVEPGDTQLAQGAWITGIMKSVADSSGLNQRAALWIAVSVGLGAVGGVLSVLTGWDSVTREQGRRTDEFDTKFNAVPVSRLSADGEQG